MIDGNYGKGHVGMLPRPPYDHCDDGDMSDPAEVISVRMTRETAAWLFTAAIVQSHRWSNDDELEDRCRWLGVAAVTRNALR